MEVSIQPPLKRTKRLTSVVWNDFERVKKGETMMAICNHCKKKLSGSSTSGTSHLRNHLKRCLRRANQDITQRLLVLRETKKEAKMDLGNIKFDQEQSSIDLKFNLDQNQLDVKFDQDRSRSDLARMIIQHGYPLAMVEHVGFRKFVANLQPLFQIISSNSTEADCMEIYEREKRKVYEMLEKVPGRISLTADVWTSHQDKKYLCLTAHYIDGAWQLQKKILNFRMLVPDTDEALSDAIVTCLMDWNIDHKLFSITLDNSSTCDSSISRVRHRLSQSQLILHNGQLFHVRCTTHILYEIVQDLLEELHEITHKIRESVRYIKTSEATKQKFGEIGLGGSQKSLNLDCPAKWDSTYLMLEASVEQKDAFCHLQECDPGFTMAPSAIEWERASAITNCLKPLHEVTNMFSGVKYPTANLYFPEVCDINLQLIRWCNSSDICTEAMAFKMKNKFDMYWSISSLCLAITAVLDPRYKMKLVEYYYHRIYDTGASDRITEVFHGIKDLYNEYANSSTLTTGNQGLSCEAQSSCGLTGVSSNVTNDSGDRLSGFDRFLEETSSSPHRQSDLDKYLEEPVFPRNMDFNILNWWKVNSPKYPILSIMARDVLGVPMSIKVASSSAFDTRCRVLDSHQSSLSSDVLQALICTHDWFQTELTGSESKHVLKSQSSPSFPHGVFLSFTTGEAKLRTSNRRWIDCIGVIIFWCCIINITFKNFPASS